MATNTIYTIGHGTRTVEQLVESLRTYRVEFLIDVRSHPYSKYCRWFNRETLEQSLQGTGIRYVFLGDQLGGLPPESSYFADENGKRRVVYSKLRNRPEFVAGIGRLKKACADGYAVALMCSELKPEKCHRSKAIGESLVAENISVLHIDEHDRLKPHGEVMQLVFANAANLSATQQALPGLEDSFRLASEKQHRFVSSEGEHDDD